MSRRGRRRPWTEPTYVTAARVLALWPLWCLCGVGVIAAPGLTAGGMVMATLWATGQETKGAALVFGCGALAASLFVIIAIAVDSPWSAFLWPLGTYAGVALGLRWGFGDRVPAATHVVLVIAVIAFVAAAVVFPRWSEVAGIVAPIVITGVGLGLAISPRVPLVREHGPKLGPAPVIALVLATVPLLWLNLPHHPKGFEELSTSEPSSIFVLLLFALALLFLLVALSRLVALLRVARAPVLTLPSSEGEVAKVHRRDGTSMSVHVDAGLAASDTRTLTLLGYFLDDDGASPYRTNLPQVTADAVFRGSPKEARGILLRSAGTWLGWSLFTAAVGLVVS